MRLVTERSNVSDRNSDGTITYGGSNPPAAPFFSAHTNIGWKEEYRHICKNLKHSGRDELFYYEVPLVVQRRLNLPKNNRVSFVDIPKPVDSIWHKDNRGKWVLNIYTRSGNGRTDYRQQSFQARDNESWCIDVSQEHRVCTPLPRQFVQIELAQDWEWPDTNSLWHEWLDQKHCNKLLDDRAWLHLDHESNVSQLKHQIDWHQAPGIWGLVVVPIKGTTTIEYKDYSITINKPMLVQTNILHKWKPNSKNNVFWAFKIK